MKLHIFFRVYRNLRVYGFKRTLKKLISKLFLKNSDLVPSHLDFKDNSIEIFPNVELFLGAAFPKIYLKYLEEARDWFYNWKKSVKEAIPDAPVEWNAGEGLSIFLYVSVKVLKPALIVETGTANGTSSAAILAALHSNNFGKLETFDIYKFGLKYVPDYLKNRVQSHVLGDRSELEQWMIENKKIITESSIFFHDSNHSFEHQLWEYEKAKMYGFGHLISDDVDDSFAFIKTQFMNKIVAIDGNKMIGLCTLNAGSAVNLD